MAADGSKVIVNEVRVGEGFVEAKFAGLDLIFKEQDGFVNATQLCKLKCRVLSNYQGTQQTKSLKRELTAVYGELCTKVTTKLDARLPGTYFHPALLLDLAAWLAPETYVGAAVIIDAYFDKTDARQEQLRNLLACDENATYESKPPICWIRYHGFDVLVDARGWFRTVGFCRALGTAVDEFEKRKSNCAAVEYFRSLGQSQSAYYHPLLFLRLAAWVDADIYAKSACVVFCCPEARLRDLFRNEIAAAGAASVRCADTVGRSSTNTTNGQPPADCAGPSTSAVLEPAQSAVSSEFRPRISVVAPARLLVNGERLSLDAPSTSSGQADPGAPDFGEIIWDTKDDDSEDSNMTQDMNNETEDMNHETEDTLTRTEHEVELNRLRRDFESQVERLRIEKEAAVARENQKAAELARVEREKLEALERERVKDDRLEQLQRQLEDMQISESRMTLRKRTHAESRANTAATTAEELGVARLECLVLFVSTENAVYGYRRQFQNIVPAIHKQLHKVASFVGWFVTNNAVLDYNRCKTLVDKKAKECQRNVRFSQNQMELADDQGATFDLPDTIRTTLRIDLEVIEADVRILSRLFGKPTYEESAVPAHPTSAFLERVHKWIEDEHASFTSVLTKRRGRRNRSTKVE